MALGTDRIPARRRKLGRVYHFAFTFDVQGTGSVTPFTGNTVLIEGRISIGVYRAFARARLAGVAEKAGWLDGPAPSRCRVGRVARRDVPGTGLRVPCDRRLEKESVADVAKAATGNAGSNVVAKLALISLFTLGQ